MSAKAENALDVTLRDAVLERLGFSAQPRANLDGLRALYRAWCECVPFENVGKVIALRSGADLPLPGGFAPSFFRAWLAQGSGGTCWSTANALKELLVALGFQARRVTGHMRDAGITNHGTVIVDVDGGEWLVDSSLLTHIPLPLTSQTFLGQQGAFAAEVEPVEGAHVLWAYSPPGGAHFPCRIFRNEVAHDEYLQRYEASRVRSPFNSRLYIGRNRGRETHLIVGNVRWSRSDQGVASHVLSPDDLVESLQREFDLDRGFVDRWAAVGGLESAFEEPAGPEPPPETRKPPSQR
jgi:N-hydroxyarylamine O-acetyltransferase